LDKGVRGAGNRTPFSFFSFIVIPAKAGVAPAGLPGLSMGMSADCEQAVALGATYIRVGTALLGERGK
jgi:hypothetical protein